MPWGDRTGKQPGGRCASSCHIFVSSLSKDTSAFMVNPLTEQGVTVVVVAYDIAPKGNADGRAGWKAGGLWRGESPQ